MLRGGTHQGQPTAWRQTRHGHDAVRGLGVHHRVHVQRHAPRRQRLRSHTGGVEGGLAWWRRDTALCASLCVWTLVLALVLALVLVLALLVLMLALALALLLLLLQLFLAGVRCGSLHTLAWLR